MGPELSNAIRSKTTLAAYLAYAPGRNELDAFAKEFALKVLCNSRTGCGVCGGCKKALSGNHIDMLEIRSEGSVKIDAVRQVIPFVSEKPFEAENRLVIIHAADTMTIEAQNSLLKVIEEPPEHAIFLLTATNPKSVLKTVLSRCSMVRVEAEAPEKCAEILSCEGVPLMTAKVLAAYSGGYISDARGLAANNDFLKARSNAAKVFERISRARGMAITSMLNTLLEDEGIINYELDALLLMFRDALLYKCTDSTKNFMNADKVVDIKRYAEYFTTSELHNIITILIDTCEKIMLCKGINKQLTLTEMLFDILEVKLNGNSNRH